MNVPRRSVRCALAAASLLLGTACGLGSSGDSTSTASGPAADVPNPCDVVSAAQVRRLVGGKLTAERDPVGDGTLVQNCDYRGGGIDTPTLTLQSTPSQDSIDQVVSLMTAGREEDDVTPVDVEGAEDAAMITERDPSLDIVTLVASTGNVLHTVIVGAKDARTAQDIAREAIALLVAG